MTHLKPRIIYLCFYLLLLTGAQCMAEPAGPTARWTFDEGQGNVARSTGSVQQDAQIGGATWVKHGDGYAISFDGLDDYVDGGDSKPIGIGGPVTIEAWVKPTRKASGEAVLFGESYSTYIITYYNTEMVPFYIGSGGNSSAGHVKLNQWNHIVGQFDGTNVKMWINGRKTGDRKSKFTEYTPGAQFMMATKGRPDLPHYKGLMDDVRVYDRSLSEKEVVRHFKNEAGNYGFDTTWFKRVKTKPYYYFDRNQIVVEADYRGLLPLAGQGRIHVTLANKANPDKVIEQQTLSNLNKTGIAEATFNSSALSNGDYLIRATLTDDQGARPIEEMTFSYPPEENILPAPREKVAGPLADPDRFTPFQFKMGDTGGFTVKLNGESYPFRSRISWPNGDFNYMGDAGKGEKNWKVDVLKTADTQYKVNAAGDYYKINRVVDVRNTHIYIKDTYTNTTDGDLGLLIYNESPVAPGQVKLSLNSGREKTGRPSVLNWPESSPSVFFADDKAGIGILPVDDVYVIQSLPYVEWQGAAGIGDEKFALPAGGSYTLEWAVYPTGSRDYYDFINNFRIAENRIATVRETVGFISYGPNNRRQVPDRDFIKKRGLTVGVISCLSQTADDPEVSIEGIEFMDFPREMQLTKAQTTAIHKMHPGFKTVFHIAHSLYATDKPERFDDSKVILENGKHAVWGSDNYISKRRQEAGWQWWIYYPTPGNKFHDAMMKSVDVMMDDMGMDGAFMDGFFAGYISQWSHDTDVRWDGHSADIDMATKTIKRRVNSVLLLSQPSMIAYARKIRDKGGIIIGNNAVFTRSIANEKYIIYDNECASGPDLHLSPSVTALAAPPFYSEKEIYLDVLDKLSWGMLFMYYNERINPTTPTLAARQYPMTFQEIRSGMVKGRQRIVTMNNGVYGWQGDKNMHMVYKYDDRGAPAAHDYITTVDADSVRTELNFAKNESAVIEPIPIWVTCSSPVNMRVTRYDGHAISMKLNGTGEVSIESFVGTLYPERADGVFTDGGVNPADVGVGRQFNVTIGDETTTMMDKDGSLYVTVNLSGPVEITIQRAP